MLMDFTNQETDRKFVKLVEYSLHFSLKIQLFSRDYELLFEWFWFVQL